MCARALFLLSTLFAVGCVDQTAVMVVVTSTELHVPADLDTLHFQATTPSGLMASQDYRVSSLPQSVAIRPGTGEHAERVTITVTGSLGATVVARTTTNGMLVPGATTTVDVALVRCTSACGSLDGGMEGGVTDLGGLDGGADLGPPDLGEDTGPTDLGPPDTGPADTGPPDLGMPGSCSTGGCATHVVISEVATGSSATGTDEFVELYNPTSATVDASGMLIEYKSAGPTATWTTRASLPPATSIPAYSYYLVASAGYLGPTPDTSTMARWSSGFASAGGHVHIVLAGAEVDRLGWGTAPMPEGTASPGFSSDSSRSYERRAFSTSDLLSMTTGVDATYGNSLDTDDNATDFVVRPMRDPQNSASPPETP